MSLSLGLTVVGVDGSDEATSAVRWAARRAVAIGTELRLLHAYAAPVMAPAAPFGAFSPGAQEAYERAGRALLAEATAVAEAEAEGEGSAGAALRITTHLVVGGAAQALVEASARAGLVVVGSRGHGGFADLLLGSVSVQVSSHATCPTAVVRGHPRSDGPIVVGVDGSPPSNAALRFAFVEASRERLPVLAVCASPPQPTGLGEAFAAMLAAGQAAVDETTARRTVTGAVAPLRSTFPHVEVREMVVEKGPASALIEASQGARLVVVGSRGHGGFAGLLLGSTSQQVLHHAACPVVLTRAVDQPPSATG